MRTIDVIRVSFMRANNVVLGVPSVEGNEQFGNDRRIATERDGHQVTGHRNAVDRNRVEVRIPLPGVVVDVLVEAVVILAELLGDTGAMAALAIRVCDDVMERQVGATFATGSRMAAPGGPGDTALLLQFRRPAMSRCPRPRGSPDRFPT